MTVKAHLLGENQNKSRMHSLDVLRGICAFGIMIYHYMLYAGWGFDANDAMQRIGIYGVSIFYILSGLTLYYVYQKSNFFKKNDVFDFFIKRIFRIFPLFSLVTLIVFFASKQNDWYGLLINLTGLFSILDWSRYFITGGWSIGNELFFYLLFPISIILINKKRIYFFGLLSLSFFFYIYFSFFVISPSLPMPGWNWHIYINPLNQLYLFLSGILLAYIYIYIYRFKSLSKYSPILIIGTLVLFFLYPAEGDATNLVTGKERLIFTFLSIILVFLFFTIENKFHHPLAKPFVILGEISYAVYLIHPIVYAAIRKMASLPLLYTAAVSIALTLVFSYLSFQYFEKFFMRQAKKITQSKLR